MPGSSQRLSASCGWWRTAPSTRLMEALMITSGRCWRPWERPWSTRSTHDHTQLLPLWIMLSELHLDLLACLKVTLLLKNWISLAISFLLDCNILNRWGWFYSIPINISGQNLKWNNKIHFSSCVLYFNFNLHTCRIWKLKFTWSNRHVHV